MKPEKVSRNIYKPKVDYLEPGPTGKYRDSLTNLYCWQIEDCTMNPTDPYLCIKSFSEKYQSYYWYNDRGQYSENGPFLVNKGMAQGIIVKKHPKYRFKISCLGGCGSEQLNDCKIRNERNLEKAVYVGHDKWLYTKSKYFAFPITSTQ